MRKQSKPKWLKALIKIGCVLLSIIFMVSAGCIYVYAKYKVNVVKAISQVKELKEDVKINKLVTNPFTEDDIAQAKLISDDNLRGFITHNEEQGYVISPDLIEGNMQGDLRFTDKQVAAIIDTIIKSDYEIEGETQSESETELILDDYIFEVLQVSFSNLTDKRTDFNVVMRMNLTWLKEGMNMFPFSLITKVIPDDLYFSSTITVRKGDEPFEYTTVGKSIRINNFSEKETEHFLKALGLLFDTVSAKTLSNNIGEIFMNSLVGTEDETGIAYALKSFGATDFNFETDGTNIYFVIES